MHAHSIEALLAWARDGVHLHPVAHGQRDGHALGRPHALGSAHLRGHVSLNQLAYGFWKG